MGGYTRLRVRILSIVPADWSRTVLGNLATAFYVDSLTRRFGPNVLPAHYVVSLQGAKPHGDESPRCVVAVYGIAPCHNPDEVVK